MATISAGVSKHLARISVFRPERLPMTQNLELHSSEKLMSLLGIDYYKTPTDPGIG